MAWNAQHPAFPPVSPGGGLPLTSICHILFLRYRFKDGTIAALVRHHYYSRLSFMTGKRASTSVMSLAACLMLWSALMIQSARAQDAGRTESASAEAIRFDLPAQPLAEALQAYGRVAELSVMAQTELLNGRVSAPVNGSYPVREALQRLLAGTGLQARFSGDTEAIIVPLPLEQQPALPDTPSVMIPSSAIDGALAGDGFDAYNAMVQTRLTEALCASPETRPGSYRAVVQMRIGDGGAVVAAKLAGSTGDPARDTAITQAMHTLVLDSAPPADLPQPVTILLRPHGDGVNTDCAQFDVRSR